MIKRRAASYKEQKALEEAALRASVPQGRDPKVRFWIEGNTMESVASSVNPEFKATHLRYVVREAGLTITPRFKKVRNDNEGILRRLEALEKWRDELEGK